MQLDVHADESIESMPRMPLPGSVLSLACALAEARRGVLLQLPHPVMLLMMISHAARWGLHPIPFGGCMMHAQCTQKEGWTQPNGIAHTFLSAYHHLRANSPPLDRSTPLAFPCCAHHHRRVCAQWAPPAP